MLTFVLYVLAHGIVSATTHTPPPLPCLLSLKVLKVDDVQADLLKPAVDGTLNVLRAAKRGALRALSSIASTVSELPG